MIMEGIFNQECVFLKVNWSKFYQLLTYFTTVVDLKHQFFLIFYRNSSLEVSVLDLDHQILWTFNKDVGKSTFATSFITKYENYILVDDFFQMIPIFFMEWLNID